MRAKIFTVYVTTSMWMTMGNFSEMLVFNSTLTRLTAQDKFTILY
jgi:hypothetical protein